MSAPEAVCVIGGGRMGSGIAQVFAELGSRVVVVEANSEVIAQFPTHLAGALQRAAERGKLRDDSQRIAERIQLVSSLHDLPSSPELVVEAVPELIDIKLSLLRDVEQAVSDETIIASNTSSLSISALSQALTRPTRFLGMHFFNPVPASKLVEIVRGDKTDESVISSVGAWVRDLGKEGVIVRDSPGFATSRLGVLLGLEAIRMLEEDVASAETIDRALELGYGHAMGPLRATDLVGLDVRLAIADYLQGELGERFAPPELLREKVRRGELGRKTGQGFFSWDI